MKKNLVASLAIASTIGFLTPLSSYAFGLGKLELQSALNQPFKAEVAVNALAPGEHELLEVSLASSEEFQKAGLDRSFLLTKFKFEIIGTDKQTKILITSKEAVKEPFLDFLLTATTGQGRLLREYTVLLDPPEFVMQETGMAAQPKVETATTVTTPAPAPSQQSSNTTSYQYTQPSQSSDTYSVKRTDTLWNVALQTRPDKTVSIHKMMLALVEQNPTAFVNQNINGLKAGRTLQVPSVDVINSRTHAQAIAEVKKQNVAWKNRNKSTVAPAPVVTQQTDSSPADLQAETEQASSTASDSQTVESVESKLNLVAPEDLETSNQDASTSTMGSSEVKDLAEQLTLAQETIEAQTQENIDFQARMEALEEQVETLRRMISIKDADLARLQDILEEDSPEIASESPLTQADESVQVANENVVASVEGTDSELQPVDESVPMEAESAMGESEADFIASTAETLDLAPEQVQSVVDQVKQFVQEHKLETGLGTLLVLLLLWLIARRRNKAVTWNEAMAEVESTSKSDVTDAPLQQSVEEVDELEDEAEAPVTKGKPAKDLIEQADMFIGYADYVQAQTSLTQAHLQEPENLQATSKLLFVLYKQQNTEAFLELVNESTIDKTTPEWQDISSWGRELFPGEALFIESTEDTSLDMATDDTEADTADDTPDTKEEDDTLAFNLDDFASDTVEDDNEKDESSTTAQPDVLSFDLTDEEDAKQDLDFDTTQSERIEADLESVNEQDIEPLELDLNELESFENSDEETEDSESVDITFNEDAEHDDLANFTIDMDSSDAVDDLEFEALQDEEAEELDLGEMELHDIDEAETKLDLAAAYIDMDDPQGASNILKEVLSEGNEEQQKRAQELLDSIA